MAVWWWNQEDYLNPWQQLTYKIKQLDLMLFFASWRITCYWCKFRPHSCFAPESSCLAYVFLASLLSVKAKRVVDICWAIFSIVELLRMLCITMPIFISSFDEAYEKLPESSLDPNVNAEHFSWSRFTLFVVAIFWKVPLAHLAVCCAKLCNVSYFFAGNLTLA